MISCIQLNIQLGGKYSLIFCSSYNTNGPCIVMSFHNQLTHSKSFLSILSLDELEKYENVLQINQNYQIMVADMPVQSNLYITVTLG